MAAMNFFGPRSDFRINRRRYKRYVRFNRIIKILFISIGLFSFLLVIGYTLGLILWSI